MHLHAQLQVCLHGSVPSAEEHLGSVELQLFPVIATRGQVHPLWVKLGFRMEDRIYAVVYFIWKRLEIVSSAWNTFGLIAPLALS